MLRHIISAFLMMTALNLMAETLKSGSSMPLTAQGDGTVRIDITATPTSMKQKQGLGKTSWGVRWNACDGSRYTIGLRWGNTDFGSETDQRFMEVYLLDGDSVISTRHITDGVNLYKGPNTLKIEIDTEGGLRWNIGAKAIGATGNENLKPASSNIFEIYAAGSDLNIDRCNIYTVPSKAQAEITEFDSEIHFPMPVDITSRPQGVWTFLDRDNDARWARPGGRYELGVRENNDGDFDIIYLDGAVTNADKWKPGMKKGKLITTPFTRHYHLIWIDAMMDRLDITDECSATLNDDGSILTLSFPLDKSTMRFHRKI